jgi:hypothetical protein
MFDYLYIVLSALLFLTLSYSWTNKDSLNKFFKFIFFCLGIYGLIVWIKF